MKGVAQLLRSTVCPLYSRFIAMPSSNTVSYPSAHMALMTTPGCWYRCLIVSVLLTLLLEGFQSKDRDKAKERRMERLFVACVNDSILSACLLYV